MALNFEQEHIRILCVIVIAVIIYILWKSQNSENFSIVRRSYAMPPKYWRPRLSFNWSPYWFYENEYDSANPSISHYPLHPTYSAGRAWVNYYKTPRQDTQFGTAWDSTSRRNLPNQVNLDSANIETCPYNSNADMSMPTIREIDYTSEIDVEVEGEEEMGEEEMGETEMGEEEMGEAEAELEEAQEMAELEAEAQEMAELEAEAEAEGEEQMPVSVYSYNLAIPILIIVLLIIFLYVMGQ